MVKSAMKKVGLALSVCALAAVGCFALAGCDEGDTREAGRVFDHTITEQDVIDYIDEYREGSATTSDEDWAAWLAKKDTNAEKLRKEVVTYLCENWLVERAAGQLGVGVSEEEVDAKLKEQKDKYPSEMAWQRAIINSGYTQDTFKLSVKSDLLKERIKEFYADPSTVNDDELEEYANSKMTGSVAKGTHSIYIKVDGDTTKFSAKAKAQDALNELKSGAKFADVFAKYSDTTYSEDGDMGYSMISVPNLQYRNAINELRNKGDISDVVEAEDGYYVIVLTDLFEDKEDGTIKLSKFPQSLLDGFRSELAKEKTDEKYNEFYTENVSEAQIAVEPMPSDLPYDIDPAESADDGDEGSSQSSS